MRIHSAGELAFVLDRVEASLLEQGLSKDVAGEMRLVAEEALTNVLSYAHRPAEQSMIEVNLEVNSAFVRLTLRDHGQAFNPLELSPAELDLPIEERPVGGLGGHLIKTLTDEQISSRERDENVLVLVKRRESLPL